MDWEERIGKMSRVVRRLVDRDQHTELDLLCEMMDDVMCEHAAKSCCNVAVQYPRPVALSWSSRGVCLLPPLMLLLRW